MIADAGAAQNRGYSTDCLRGPSTSAEDEEALKRTRNYGSIGYVGMDLEAVRNVHPRYH
jgi:hypothetical protein